MAGTIMLLLVFLLALFTLTVYSELIANINCGGSPVDWYSMTWSPDDTLISNGVTRVVQPSNSINPVVDTLRVFTSRKKNCYSIGSKLQGIKVLVRATFYYGNYDQLSNPPTFDLHFDGNFWTTVETDTDYVIRYETTYVAKGDSVSVCVAQTKPRQFPFISALEVRRVDPEVYEVVDKNRALFLRVRINFGANETIRYPLDKYDRIWRYFNILPKIVTNNELVDTSHTANNLPSEIFQTAIESTTESFYLGSYSPSGPPVYIIMYFSEATKLISSTLKRSFAIYRTSIFESTPLSVSFSPPYGSALDRFLYNFKVDDLTAISINETSDSVLPPLISAMETFNISNVLTDGTNSNDVKALALLQSTFQVLRGWSSDPCLPAPYSWDWLNCSDDPMPRITSLNLASFNLSGSLPDISSMDALEIINLADNQFSGSIPTSLRTNNKLTLNVTGNPSLCTPDKSCSSSPADNTPDTQKKQQSMLRLIVFISILVFLGSVLVTVLAWYFLCMRKTRPNGNPPVVQGNIHHGPIIANLVPRTDEQIVNGYAVPKGGEPAPLTHVRPGNY
ncbi:malectin-like carbohydrate-binding domain-containing protein [Artemisia annua]|uniref:Malectin-like carbohydrate-binding domain-containing protein n=1 Tax=Artemisia annua TaxID=35608 RepID=A0A2U1PIL5_ARTAN|nr:malectin-like carbohydrate-binding domain-containing protein [Artemisia annua]